MFVLGVILLPVVAVASSAIAAIDSTGKTSTVGQNECSKYGPGYAPIQTLKYVELSASNVTACLHDCANRKPQVNCMDAQPNYYAKRVATATCAISNTFTYSCTFWAADGSWIYVLEWAAAYNERAPDNPHCVLEGSLFVDFSTDLYLLRVYGYIFLGLVLFCVALIVGVIVIPDLIDKVKSWRQRRQYQEVPDGQS